MKKIALFLFVFTYTYALIRYHLGKDVPAIEWVYVLNKAVSWTGFCLVGLSILPKFWFTRNKLNRTQAGEIGYALCFLHLLFNLILMNPERYPFLYLENNEWSWQGIVTLILGSLSLACFTIALIGSLNLRKWGEKVQKKYLRFGKIGFFISMLHPLVMSADRWFTSDWPYYMPPITLLAVLIGVLLFCVRIVLKRRAT